MGLFSKLKSSMDGGVQLHIQAPGSVPANQVIPVMVTITANGMRTINSVKAEIKAEAREEGIAMGNGRGVGVQNSSTMAQTIAQVESRESFSISPGETKTVNLQLYINGGVAGINPMGQMSNVGGVLGGVLQTVASFEHVNYLYSVHASADVQDVHLSPSDKQPIQILPPAEAAPAASTTTPNSVFPNQAQPPASSPQASVPPQDQSSGQQGGGL